MSFTADVRQKREIKSIDAASLKGTKPRFGKPSKTIQFPFITLFKTDPFRVPASPGAVWAVFGYPESRPTESTSTDPTARRQAP